MPGRAEVDIRLPAQLRRPLQRPIRRLLPLLAGLVQPVPRLGRPRFPRPPLLRDLRVVALEPLLPAALDPVMAPLGEHQVRVGILPGLPAPMDRQRIGQPLRAGQLPGEARGHLPPLGRVQLLGQGELHLAVQPPVGPLVLVRRLILMGSYLEHLTGDNPAQRDSLTKGLDGFLERPQDRALFDLSPRPDPDS